MSREKHLKRLMARCWKPETHEQGIRLVAVHSDSGGKKIDYLEVFGLSGKVVFMMNDKGKPRVSLIRCGQTDLHIDGPKCSKDVVVWSNDNYGVVEIWYSKPDDNIQSRSDTSGSSADLLLIPKPIIPVPPPPTPPPYVPPPEDRPPLWALWEDLPATPRTPSSIEMLDSSVYPIDSEGRIHSLPLDNNESLHNLRIDKLFLEHNVSIHTNQFTILEHNVSSPSDSTAFEYEKLVEPLPVGFWSNPPVWL